MSELAVCPSSSSDEQHDQVQSYEVSHDDQRIGFAMVASFSGRAARFYDALVNIADYLPPEGDKCKEAMKIVTDQRIWMFDTGILVGKFIGSFFYLEKNILNELQIFYETSQQQLPISVLKVTMQSTLDNLTKLETARKDGLDTVLICEKKGDELVMFKGENMKVQHAVMHQIGLLGGTHQGEAFLDDLQKANEKVTKCQTDLKGLVEEFQAAEADACEQSCKLTVYDTIANNTQKSMAEMNNTADSLQSNAVSAAQEAGRTNNTSYSYRHTFLGITVARYEHRDNAGDRAAERARKLKQYAADAKQDLATQQDRAQAAAGISAETKAKLEKAKARSSDLRKKITEQEKACEQAKSELKALEEKIDSHRKEFGGMSIKHIASLRHHMQQFPALLGGQGMANSGMFAAMKGALQGHEFLLNSMRNVLKIQDDAGAVYAARALQPVIKKAIQDATFFALEMGPLKDHIDQQMQRVQKTDTAAPLAIAAPAAETMPATPAEHMVSMADDDDDLW